MIKNISGEKWNPFQFKGHKTMRNKYAISSRRIATTPKTLSKTERF